MLSTTIPARDMELCVVYARFNESRPPSPDLTTIVIPDHPTATYRNKNIRAGCNRKPPRCYYAIARTRRSPSCRSACFQKQTHNRIIRSVQCPNALRTVSCSDCILTVRSRGSLSRAGVTRAPPLTKYGHTPARRHSSITRVSCSGCHSMPHKSPRPYTLIPAP
jgi:hypothetical protein